jgi:hydroxyacylglutathione hydrolase
LVLGLQALGVGPGALRLVVLTHVDARSAGNAAFLQRQYRAPVAVHAADAPILAAGLGRRPRPASLLGYLTRLYEPSRFLATVPDLVFTHTIDLRLYGIPGQVVHTPAATVGSCSVLLTTGDAVCGDVVVGGWWSGRVRASTPVLPTLAEMPEQIAHVVGLLRRLGARRLHPAQGATLRMADVLACVAPTALRESVAPTPARVRRRRLALLRAGA